MTETSNQYPFITHYTPETITYDDVRIAMGFPDESMALKRMIGDILEIVKSQPRIRWEMATVETRNTINQMIDWYRDVNGADMYTDKEQNRASGSFHVIGTIAAGYLNHKMDILKVVQRMIQE